MINPTKPLKARIYDSAERLDGVTEMVVDVQMIILPHLPYQKEIEIVYGGGRSQAFEFLPQE